MAKEFTLSIVKPDAMAKHLADAIIEIFNDNAIVVDAQKSLTLTKEQAEEFYAEHKDRPFFNDLVTFMTSGKVLVMILSGDDVISRNREIMGATNPANAKEGTIRARFAESTERNCVHGSDSPESAAREIKFFFGDTSNDYEF